jgi:formate hydrogenlyase transcriptional activator
MDAGRADSRGDLRRYEALLDMADVMVQHSSLQELLQATALRLQEVTIFQFLNFSVYEPARKVMVLHTWQDSGQSPLAMEELPVEDAVSGWVLAHQEILWLPELSEEQRFSRVLDPLRAAGFRSYVVLPLSTPRRRLGALGIASRTPNAHSDDDLRLFRRIAELVAIAMENVQTREALEAEKKALKAMVEVNRSLVSSLDLNHLFPVILDAVGKVVPHDFAGLTIYDPDKPGAQSVVLAAPEKHESIERVWAMPVEEPLVAPALLWHETRRFDRQQIAAMRSEFAARVLDAGIQSMLCVPLKTPKRVLGTLNVGSIQPGAFSDLEEGLIQQVASQIAVALDNARAYREIEELRDRLAKEKSYLEDEIQTELHFEEIIGESPLLKRVLSQVRTVAPSGATALILGETGTGKELIARAIHRMSGRKDKSFIKMNCAAIPTGLLESELFGHEKGAFTGAVSQKVGRMELADKGTLFLDEIGDIPLELQPKLLRVLQDQEFERLGGTKTIRVDVRLVAATNRDLSKSVAEGHFRNDLFYRLNVFPIRLPSLRERREDVPLLVRYFTQKLAQRMDKKIENIPNATMQALMRWKWPGNVRELENFIERSVILSDGPSLRVPLAELEPEYETARTDHTLHTAERQHIIRVLRECGGVVSGIRGAAAKLGLKRTTLQSKMRKLGIARQDYIN